MFALIGYTGDLRSDHSYYGDLIADISVHPITRCMLGAQEERLMVEFGPQGSDLLDRLVLEDL